MFYKNKDENVIERGEREKGRRRDIEKKGEIREREREREREMKGFCITLDFCAF